VSGESCVSDEIAPLKATHYMLGVHRSEHTPEVVAFWRAPGWFRKVIDGPWAWKRIPAGKTYTHLYRRRSQAVVAAANIHKAFPLAWDTTITPMALVKVPE
jgi:hypothetical protein